MNLPYELEEYISRRIILSLLLDKEKCKYSAEMKASLDQAPSQSGLLLCPNSSNLSTVQKKHLVFVIY